MYTATSQRCTAISTKRCTAIATKRMPANTSKRLSAILFTLLTSNIYQRLSATRSKRLPAILITRLTANIYQRLSATRSKFATQGGSMAPKGPRTLSKRSRDESIANLQPLLHTGSISRSGLTAILQQLNRRPVGVVTGWDLQQAEWARFSEVSTTETLRLEDGTDWTWELCEPCLLIQHTLAACPQMQEVYDAAFEEASGEPWDIIVAFDEFTPGNLHRPDNQRKSMTIGINFLNLGQEAVTSDLMWFIPVVVRSTKIQKVIGGFSYMLKLFLRRLLFGPCGLSTAGVLLTTTRGERRLNVLLTAQLWTMLSDGDGLRQALDWKGAASMKPDFKHVNVLRSGADVAYRRPGYVEASCSDPSKFERLSREELGEFVDLLRAAAGARGTRGGQGRFVELQKALGFNHNEGGLIFDDDLRQRIDILDVASYDWVHACLQDGSVNLETLLFLGRCSEKVGMEMATIERYLKGKFTFPKFSRTLALLTTPIISTQTL